MGKNKSNNNISCSVDNIYRLDGRVPVGNAIPFGMQHVLAMFVSNLVPITVIVATTQNAGKATPDVAVLLQNCMFIAGIGTLLQLYPIGRIGSKLPVVMGVSFSFMTTLIYIGPKYGYPALMGAIIVGGLIEGCLGLTAKYWRKFIQPIVSACVVTTIGFSLLASGVTSLGGGSSTLSTSNGSLAGTFGDARLLTTGFITLLACLLFKIFLKGFLKQLNILFGLIVGYIVSCILGIVDFSGFSNLRIFSIPQIFPVYEGTSQHIFPEFVPGAIIALIVVFLVSAAETIGDTSAIVSGGLGRQITEREISGSLCVDGFISSVSGCFGCSPITSFSQNVGLVAMTKVVNRFSIMFGALLLIICGLVPPIGAFFKTVPQPVVGGCTLMLFGSIVVSGMKMIGDCGWTQRNTTIASISLALGIGVTQVDSGAIYKLFPKLWQDVFCGNPIANVFVLSMVLSLVLPKDMEMSSMAREQAKELHQNDDLLNLDELEERQEEDAIDPYKNKINQD